MQTLRITAPHFVAAVVVSNDLVFQAGPVLHWSVGRSLQSLRDHCQQRGWQVEELHTPARPQMIEIDNHVYELKWNGNVITRVLLHEDGEIKSLRYVDMPEQLRKILE